jgi:ankyrin repeat protein
MRDHGPAALHMCTVLALTLSLAACSGVGEDEQAFCDAVERYDAAAAQKLLDTGQIDMTAGGGSACSPALAVFERASERQPKFIAMAVALAKQPGVATRCFGNRSSGSRYSRRTSGPSGQTCPINLAADNASPEVMRALVENGASVTNVDGDSALIAVVLQGSLPTLKVMLEAGASKNDALTSAVAQEKPELIAYLESIGAVEEGVDPFLIAARKGDMAALEAALARRVDLEMTDGGKRTAMMRAAMYGRSAVITRLAKAGANVNPRFEMEFDTPVHMAVRGNHADAVRALAAAGADLNARYNEDTHTPVMEAVNTGQAGRVEALAALVDLKANVNVGSAADTTAIDRAIELGNLALVKQLLRGGARVNDKGGPGWKPPIHSTLDNCGLPPEGPGENDNFRMNMLKTLVAAGADPRAKNAKGETALQAITRLRAEAEPFEAHDPQGFRRACFQAKLEYIRTLQ